MANFRPAHFLTLTFLLMAGSAHAAPDFYGVKMKSEDFAKDLAVREANLVPDFSNDRPGIDRRIYAYAYTSTFFGRGRGLSITVYNHSEKTLATERLFRECVLITRDGRRFDRMSTEMQLRRDKLEPGQNATFNMIFPGLHLDRSDIQMIIFSFDMGKTNIFLFPMNPPVEKVVATPKKSALVAGAVKKTTEAKSVTPSPPARPRCITPVTMVQSVFGGLGRTLGSFGHRSRKAPDVVAEPDPGPSADAPYFSPEFKKKVEDGEKEVKSTVFVDRPWSLGNPDKGLVSTMESYPLPKAQPPRVKAQVVQVNSSYGFIVFNAGTVDGVKNASVVSVLRDGRRIGKAMVKKVRDKVSAASILPEWQTNNAIRAGDQVEIS